MEKATQTLNKRKRIIDLCIIFFATAISVLGFLIAVQFMGSRGGLTVSGAGNTTGLALLLAVTYNHRSSSGHVYNRSV